MSIAVLSLICPTTCDTNSRRRSPKSFFLWYF